MNETDTPKFQPPYRENVFHVVGIDGLQLSSLWDEAPAFCHDDGFSGEILVNDYDDEDPDVEFHTAVLRLSSAQGIEITFIRKEVPVLHIELPWLASIGDVKLAFAFLMALRKLYPDCEIYMDDVTDAQFDLVKGNYDALVTRRLLNMKSLIEYPDDGYMGANGISHEFIVPNRKDFPDVAIEDQLFRAINTFVELQWDYAGYHIAPKAETVSPSGEKYTMRILTNDDDTFVKVCQHIGVFCANEVKDVEVDAFIKAVKDTPYFKKLDALQFVVNKMPQDKWQQVFDSLDAEVMRHPKTYLLRWNPAISSFKIEYYKRALAKYPDGFTLDWSVYEWEEAHKGDRFYMLRTGDEQAGIVFRGIFTSEPYKGDDWAGKGKTRYYMDMDCYDGVPADAQPPVNLEILEKTIPEIDWRRGHSGQLLTPYIAEKLGSLWSELVGKGDAE